MELESPLEPHRGRDTAPLAATPTPRYRMVVSDIDGTLLNSESEVTDAVRAAVAEARRAGVIFTLATGRRYATTEKILRELDLLPDGAPLDLDGLVRDSRAAQALISPPIVLQTGAVVVSADGHQLLFRDPIAHEDAQYVLRTLLSAGLQPILYEDRIPHQRLYTGPEEFDSPGARQYLSNNPHLVVRVPYDELIVEGDQLQIVVVDRREVLEPVMPRLEFAHCRTLLSYSGALDSCFMEVFHKGCTKRRAVERLAQHLGFGIEDTVCIGDNWNDIEMLAGAGCGVAVSNAEPGVSPFARRITVSNDEDAVAVVLRDILAGREPGQANPAYEHGPVAAQIVAD
ncbi:MAG: family phosphatase [Chloroflexi bacterium]|nr:family phosphatase [Chloroflexota bacterium]